MFYGKFSDDLLDLRLKHTVLGFLSLSAKIFAENFFRKLALDRKNCENFCLVKNSRYMVLSAREGISSDTGNKTKREKKQVLPNVEDRTLTVRPLCTANVVSYLAL